MAERQCYSNVLPFLAMMTIEFVNIGLYTLYKAATLRGMNYRIFLVYSYAIASLVLLPAPFISLRSRVLPPLSLSIMWKIGLLGLIGGLSQVLGYIGIAYSSPTLSSAIGNLTPAITFILAIIFRMERISFKKGNTQAKVLGTIVSVAGAFVITLYKGPPITINHLLHLHSSNSNWVLGSILFTSEYTLSALWYIVQTRLMKEYPAEFTLVFFFSLTVTIMGAIATFIVDGTSNVWIVPPGIALASIVCSGLFGICMKLTVHTWALHAKGPVYVAMFKPMSIVIAVAMGVTFLGDVLHLGSVIGAAIITVGVYSVIWGKAQEEKTPPCTDNTPLLKPHKDELV